MNSAMTAPIGHNSASFAEMIESDPTVIFREPEVFPGLIAEIEDDIAKAKVDLATERGRKAIASRAAQIARRKTSIDGAGKDLNEAHRKAINQVDEVRRQVRNTLDILRDKARAPLTEWEEAEAARIANCEAVIRFLTESCYVRQGATVAEVDALAEKVSATEIDADVYRDRVPVAEKEKRRALAALAEARARIIREEEERAELERLRAEAAERERREAQAAAERERQERAARAAEEQRQREEEAARRAAERAVEEERAKAAASAEADRRKAEAAAAEERRRHAEALAAERRERERLEQEAAAKAAEELRLRQEEERREANKRHRSKVLGAARDAIVIAGGIDAEAAKKVVLAIVAGEVPNVSLRF